jgi:hypothetical protein
VGSEAWRRQPVYIQSFEITSLKDVSWVTKIPLVLLMGGWEGYTVGGGWFWLGL